MKLFFIHGGPGLNSFTEKKVLEEPFLRNSKSIEFWNEPSKFRKNQNKALNAEIYSFSNWLQSAEAAFLQLTQQKTPIYIIAHSFGVHAAIHLSQKFQSLVGGMTFIAPSTAVFETQKSILRIAYHDFRKSQPDLAQKLEQHLSLAKTSMDSEIQMGLNLAFQDLELFNAYWTKKEKMNVWLSILSSPESQFDFDSFWGVAQSFEGSHLNFEKPLNLSIQLVFGENDPLVHSKEERRIISSRFLKTQEVFIENAAHYPHLEHPEHFTSIVLHHLNQLERPLL